MSRKNSNDQSSSPRASLSPSPSTSPTSQALTTTTGSILLLVFIHGFKGTDTTFEEFPQRLQHLLTQTVPNLKVESLVFPAYETKGELDKAVVLFADWLTTAVVEREVASGGGAGSAKIVLCGHSMGGLLAADSLRGFIDTRPDSSSPPWPRIIACIAFDTPYLGLHPNLVKDGVTKAADHVNAASTLGSALFGSFAGFTAGKAAQGAPSSTPAPPNAAAAREPAASGWTKWAAPAAYAIGGALLAGAAAGGAYYARDHLNTSYTWLMDHMKYVGNLWDEATSNKRIETLVDIEEAQGVVFRNFYTVIPPSAPTFLESRTFAVLPRLDSRASSRFIPSKNTMATDEIAAHTGMFSASTNDGYYDLGLAVAKVVREAYGKAVPVSATAISTSRSTRRRSSAHGPGTSSPPQPRSRAAQTKGTPGPRPAGPLSSEKAQEDLIRL